MFSEGDLIVYGGTGVCRVNEIAKRNLAGEKQARLYYILQPLYQKCVISAPVDTTKVFMRPIISREEAERLISLIPNIRAEAYHNRALRQLAEHYDELLKSHECEELIKLTMSIYEKRRIAESQNKKFGAVDERFMKRAEELLFGELAASLEIPKDEVPSYIEERVGGLESNRN